YEAQPVSSCRNCLKYIRQPPPWEREWYPRRAAASEIRARGGAVRYARPVRRRALWLLLVAALGAPLVALAQEAPPSYPGQSNLVPPGFPTPETAFERPSPGGPARDPGALAWAQAGPYIAPTWTNFTLRSFSSREYIATTYYFYWHDLTDPDR